MEILKALFILFFFVLLFIAPVRILGPIGRLQLKEAFRSKTPHLFGAAFFLLFGLISLLLAGNEFSLSNYSGGIAYIGLIIFSFVIWISREKVSDSSDTQDVAKKK